MHPARTRTPLDGIPSQRGSAASVPEHAYEDPTGFAVAPDASLPALPPAPVRRPWRRLLRLVPTPAGTPFTFGYALVLLATSLFADHADPDIVGDLLRGSSTDVAHLAQTPLLALVGSALWIAGGILSPYAVGFLFVLTALERRIGGWRAAGVFLLGHVTATLATELPVGLSVVTGHLPDSSLHRLDYGISFGLMTSFGALAGLVAPLLRWSALGVLTAVLVQDLLSFTDPLTGWGHLMALVIGVACWPLVRRWSAARTPPGSATTA
ncbi:rhomboid-like protein [Streptomyces sp. NBC_01465]|uniref:rhomboid-like protein n=1 Tax=Streptomyces sp. NBC_01465 TaxID=2903878 RepID=UPI002E3448AF|nr:rhomboid-like protein [Streptomyces sp. NBC_01465]